ncbi:hypothetical protein CR513_04769, partial [Mucuna pruriens]
MKGPSTSSDSYLEIELVIESLSFPTQDVIESLPIPTQDVNESLSFPTQDVQVQEVTKPTLVPKQGNDHVSSILFPNLYVLTISLYNIKILGCRCIYIMKCKFDGTLSNTKQIGYTKTYGIDYEKMFAPIVNMNMVRKKSTWRFPQDSILIMKRTRFAQVMISLGYRKSQDDHTLFIKQSPYGKLTFFLVYVDDMIVIGDDEIEKLTLK